MRASTRLAPVIPIVLLLCVVSFIYLQTFDEDTKLSINTKKMGMDYLTMKTSLQAEFQKYGSKLSNVVMSPKSMTAECVVIAAPGAGYKFTKAWIKSKEKEGIPFVLFEAKSVRSGELTPHYARIPALLASRAVLKNARYFAYSDIDAHVGFDALCGAAPKWPDVPMSISYLMHPKHLEVRTNWFIVRPRHPDTNHFLLTWLYNGRRVHLQDQRVLSELWKEKKWLKDSIHLIKFGTAIWKKIELAHCSSALPDGKRRACLRRSQHLDV